jgi:hypothetical protein
MPVRDHGGIVISQFNGLFDRGDPDSCPSDHFRDCENVRFIGTSSFGTRYGVGISQDAAAPLANIRRIYSYPTQTDSTLIILTYDPATDTGKIYHMTSSTAVFGPILTIVGMTDFAFVPYAGRGYISPFSSQENTFGAPTVAMTATLANGANIDSGVHSYASTFVTAAGETEPSPLTTVTTNTAGIVNPTATPLLADLGIGLGHNLVPGGTYHWKFAYAVDGAGLLLTNVGPASLAFVAPAVNHHIGLQSDAAIPAGAVLVGIYRTVNGGGVYYLENNAFTLPGVVPVFPSATYYDVGIYSDAQLITHPVAPAANTTTTGNVNLTNIPLGVGLSATARKIYRTAANLTQLKLLTTIADNVTTVFADVQADGTLGANAPTTNTALLGGTPLVRGLQGEFLYVYAGDGTNARKAAGAGMSGTMTIANGAAGHTDAGLHLFGFVSETRSGYLGPAGVLTQFTTSAASSVSFGAIPTSGDPNVIRRHLVATKALPTFNGDLQGYQYFFVPDATIDNNTDTFLNNISFYDQDLLDDASYLFDNYTEIPAGSVLSLYHDRLILGCTYTDISLLLVSEIGEPEAISQIDGLIVVPLDGTPVTNAQELRDVLYVFKNSRTVSYADNGDAPATWSLVVIDNALGTTQHGIATVLNSGTASVDFLIVCTYQGISLFNGRFAAPELSWKIENFWRGQDRDNFNLIQIINAPIQKEIYIVLPDNRMLCGNYGNGMTTKDMRWAPWSFLPGVNTVAIWNIDEIILGCDLNY